jgi:hypothetical protein
VLALGQRGDRLADEREGLAREQALLGQARPSSTGTTFQPPG